MAITAAQVKELREMTGAGMMDCKKALTATEGDMDKAVEFLREKGLATAQKKASRTACFLLCCSKTFFAKEFYCFIHITFCSCKSFLTIHHSGAGHFS